MLILREIGVKSRRHSGMAWDIVCERLHGGYRVVLRYVANTDTFHLYEKSNFVPSLYLVVEKSLALVKNFVLNCVMEFCRVHKLREYEV